MCWCWSGLHSLVLTQYSQASPVKDTLMKRVFGVTRCVRSGSLTQCFSAGREAAEHKDVIRRDRSEGVPGAAGRTVLRNAPETHTSFRRPPPRRKGTDALNTERTSHSIPTSPGRCRTDRSAAGPAKHSAFSTNHSRRRMFSAPRSHAPCTVLRTRSLC